jgi:hypothetical protein
VVRFDYSSSIRSKEVSSKVMASENDGKNTAKEGSVTLRPVSALVPEQVSRGVFSTGVIAITGNTEFVLDFVLNIGTPNTVVSRVICSHEALRRIVAAIQRNVEAFNARVGAAESVVRAEAVRGAPPLVDVESRPEDGDIPGFINTEQFVGTSIPISEDPPESQSSVESTAVSTGDEPISNTAKQNPLDLYDDMTIPDDVQVGVYANGLIIGHTDSEFKLDFVSNLFPKSVVTSRIFISAPQLIRLVDTLERTLHQFEQKPKSL